MANCSSNCGCGTGCASCGSSSYGGYGALNSLRQSCGQFPYYTGPCPDAPCSGCGCGGNGNGGCDSCSGSGICPRCGGMINRWGVCSGCGNHCGGHNGCPRCGGTVNRWGVCSGCGNNCGCHNSCSHHCGCGHHCCGHPHYAVFTLSGPMSYAPGGTVGLVPRDCNTDIFDIDNGSVIIRAPGCYFAALTVDIPQGTEVSTTMRLSLDNRMITPPQIAVTTDDGGITNNFAGHTVFTAGPGSVLSLETQDALEIAGATAQPVFTLTLFRL